MVDSFLFYEDNAVGSCDKHFFQKLRKVNIFCVDLTMVLDCAKHFFLKLLEVKFSFLI